MNLHELHTSVHCLACEVGELEVLYSADGEDRYRCRACKAEHLHLVGGYRAPEDRPCSDCKGLGRTTCGECDGKGRCTCRCGDEHDCHECSGRGRVSCWQCHGKATLRPPYGPCGLMLDGGGYRVDACRWNDAPSDADWRSFEKLQRDGKWKGRIADEAQAKSKAGARL